MFLANFYLKGGQTVTLKLKNIEIIRNSYTGNITEVKYTYYDDTRIGYLDLEDISMITWEEK